MSVAALLALVSSVSTASKKNVLMLVADDLRPQLNHAYGQSQMVTPNLDKLAKSSLVFDRAYTNFAICSPSRNSFLSGRMPDKTRVWNFINHFRESGLSSKGGAAGDDSDSDDDGVAAGAAARGAAVAATTTTDVEAADAMERVDISEPQGQQPPQTFADHERARREREQAEQEEIEVAMAVSLSLQEEQKKAAAPPQRTPSGEDEELKRALEISRREAQGS